MLGNLTLDSSNDRPPSTSLEFDNSKDTSGHTYSLGTNGQYYTLNVRDEVGNVRGTIAYSSYDGRALTVRGGGSVTSANVFFINDTLTWRPTSIYTGVGKDTVNDYKSSGSLTINAINTYNTDTVNLGYSGFASSVGTVTLVDIHSTTVLKIDDSADSNLRNVTVNPGSIVGLCSGVVSIDPSSIVSLTLLGGKNTNTFTVTGTILSGPTSISPSASYGGTVNVAATSSALNVNFGPLPTLLRSQVNIGNAGSMQGIWADVSISSGSYYNVSLDDSADTVARTVTISDSAVSGLGGGTVRFAKKPDTLNINSGPGGNSFTVANTPARTTLNPGSGKDSITVQQTNLNSPLSIVSSARNDTLTGPAAGATWNITGANYGTMGNVTFSGIPNLVGGAGVDSFVFGTSGSVVSIVGNGTGDWLDYSAFTSSVIVNLTTGSATNVNGGAAGAVSSIRNVIGGAGRDTLTGSALGSILVGNAGDDTLIGGAGRNILIGGTGSDTLTGGAGDDILIAGATTFDANKAALTALFKEWQRIDASYGSRILNLSYGMGYTGGNRLLYGTTVLDDQGGNTLRGDPAATVGLDWFFANSFDSILDRNQASERVK